MANLELLKNIVPRVILAVSPVLAIGALLDGYLQKRSKRNHGVASAVSEEPRTNGGNQ
jgi:hypothetical protein